MKSNVFLQTLELGPKAYCDASSAPKPEPSATPVTLGSKIQIRPPHLLSRDTN
jgi:hypothetical protein